jgi:adenylate cyclase
MPYKLTRVEGNQSYELHEGIPLVVGRAPTSDVPVFDSTISRRHAELVVANGSVSVKDLGSSNGTFINGTRVEEGTLKPTDTLVFGKVAFRLETASAVTEKIVAVPDPTAAVQSPAGTIVRAIPRVAGTALFGAMKAPMDAGAEPTPEDRDRQKLTMLLEVSSALGRATDNRELLEKIAGYVYQLLDVDRVAILLLDEESRLIPEISRDKRGADQPRAVPQSIARRAVEDRVAILSNEAGEDARFGGQSILMQRVRSAVCAPLIGGDGEPMGVLYVDNLTAAHSFDDADLDFLVAFSGIAAAAIENARFAERIRKETLVRSNFERFFAPALAARIASEPEAVRLGGDKRLVTVLFSDIRGFTSLSETMSPGDMASLLTEYFTEMVDCVFRHGGTLDKFIGDAVMAQWGAPIGTDDDADRAVRSAIDMIEALDRLNAKWRSEGKPELQIGIGLNHGEAFAGNIGSEQRLEFTVIGDTVNIASRLCSVAAGHEILISEDMRRVLQNPPKLVEVPPMELKGKSQPVPVYRVEL